MKRIITYVLCTFILTYLAHGSLAILTSSDTIEFNSLLGQTLFILGGSSPTIFAFIFIYRQKNDEVKEAFIKKLFDYKKPVYLWLFAILIPLFIGGVYQLAHILFTKGSFNSEMPLYFFFIAIFVSIIFGGLEEVGWRGYLQEQLSSKLSLLYISIIIGILWGLWHLPLFFVDEVSHSSFNFIPYMFGAVMFSTYLTWLYAKSKSILLTVFFHASINASATIGFRLHFEHHVLVYLVLTVFTVLGLILLLNLKPKER